MIIVSTYENYLVPTADNGEMDRQRQDFTAVPLLPWQALYPGTDLPYYNVSLQRIQDKAVRRFSELETDGVILPDYVESFALDSLVNTHTIRLDYNHDNHPIVQSILSATSDKLLQLACDGLAQPHELLEILKRYPQIASIELAKLSHPIEYDSDELHKMDEHVMALFDRDDIDVRVSGVRYKTRRVHHEEPAAVVVRKLELPDVPIADDSAHMIRITRRQTLLVRADDAIDKSMADAKVLPRIVRNPERLDELACRIESYFSDGQFDTQNQFVQPLTTSYYAKIVDLKK